MTFDLDIALRNVKRTPRATASRFDFVMFMQEHPEYAFLKCVEPAHIYVIASIVHARGPDTIMGMKNALEIAECFCITTETCECEKECPTCSSCPTCPSCPKPPKIEPPPVLTLSCSTDPAYQQVEYTNQPSNIED